MQFKNPALLWLAFQVLIHHTSQAITALDSPNIECSIMVEMDKATTRKHWKGFRGQAIKTSGSVKKARII